MTKAELLADLNTKYDAVDTPALEIEESPTGYNQYTVKVWDIANTTLISFNVDFYVYHEGLGDEAAYYLEEVPYPYDFQAELRIWINDTITNETVEGAYIEDIDAVNETAILRIIKNDLAEVKHFIDKDGNGDLRSRLIT